MTVHFCDEIAISLAFWSKIDGKRQFTTNYQPGLKIKCNLDDYNLVLFFHTCDLWQGNRSIQTSTYTFGNLLNFELNIALKNVWIFE